jgi:hypothetical protein
MVKRHGFKQWMMFFVSLFLLSSFSISFAFWASSILGNYEVRTGVVSIGIWLPPGYVGVTQTGQGDTITIDEIGSASYPLSGKYALLSDINWNGAFTPIGYNPNTQTTSSFTGEFRGNGFLISNITITSSGAYDYAGLFARNNGLIEGVSLINVTIDHVRSLTNVSSLSLFAGGLAGENQANGVILNSYVSGSSSISVSSSLTRNSGSGAIQSTVYTGGLVGQNLGSISESYADVTVSGTAITTSNRPNSGGTAIVYAGGLVGLNSNNQGIINTYATGDISATSSITRNQC